jgi:hypothetical protein
MGCRGCPEKSGSKVDRYGNPLNENHTHANSSMGDYEKEVYAHNDLRFRENMTYRDYKKEKEAHRKKTREMSDQIAKSFSDDYKRIQIDELIAVVNNEEVHRLSPTQSLAMLYELTHHADYQKIVDEFEGLREQVDALYNELMKNKIKVSWNPK